MASPDTASTDALIAERQMKVEWRWLNMSSQIITARLADTIGQGLAILREKWPYNAKTDGEGIAPIPHLMRLETFGVPCAIGATLKLQYVVRMVHTLSADGGPERRHVVMDCDLLDHASGALIGRSAIWSALTRPYAKRREERTPEELPRALRFLVEHPLAGDDLGSRDIESFRCEPATDGRHPVPSLVVHDTLPLVFHMDRTDFYNHVNMNVYLDKATDYLGLAHHRAGGDTGRLRFRELTAMWRKPFLPGHAADVEVDLIERAHEFDRAVRFFHADREHGRSSRISMAVEAHGVLEDE